MRCSCSARTTSATCTERSTRTAWPSTSCCVSTAIRQSAEAFFRQAIERTGVIPDEVVTDHHQPYVKAVSTTRPGARHVRTRLHRAAGFTTKAVERSHVPMRDRLRNSRGLKRTETGQRFLEGLEALRHLRRGGRPGAGHLVVAQRPTRAFGR
jgi:transposase-like protein